MPKITIKLIEVSYPLQLEIGHLLNRFSAEQEPRIEFDLSIESFSSKGVSNKDIMPSGIPFKYDFEPNKLKTLTTKKKTTTGTDTETIEVQLPFLGPACSRFQIIYCDSILSC